MVRSVRKLHRSLAIKEHATVFTSVGRLESNASSYLVPIHTWSYKQYPSKGIHITHKLFRRALAAHLDSNADSKLFFERGGLFFAPALSNNPVFIRNQTTEPTTELASNRLLGRPEVNGHFRRTVKLRFDEIKLSPCSLASQDQFAHFTINIGNNFIHGTSQLLHHNGISVISDIDDTIKISHVKSKKALLANTFFYKYNAVDGMAGLFNTWKEQGASFHYISSTPWQLYDAVANFLEESGFPCGSFHLKFFWWKDLSWLKIFASPKVTKPPTIKPILEMFPHRRFILIGDAVEKDPEIYSRLAQQFPDRIAKILIRIQDDESVALAKCVKALSKLPKNMWQIFAHASELEKNLSMLLST